MIKVEEHPSETLLITAYDFSEDDVSEVFGYLKDTWSIEQIRMGIGGFISLDKVIDENFEKFSLASATKNISKSPINLTWDYTYAEHSDEKVEQIKDINGLDVIIPT